VCDPVLGDDGALYVPEDQVKIYRDEVLPAATLLTPNQFECECVAHCCCCCSVSLVVSNCILCCRVLTGIRIDSEAAAVRAMAALHGLGVPAVVITSATLGDSEQMSLLASVPWSMVSGNADVWESPGTGACARWALTFSSAFLLQSGGCHVHIVFCRFRIDFPKLPFKFTGTGDLTASLLLAWLTKLPASFVTVCEQSLASVQARVFPEVLG
jgi:pyridoxine kinase